MAKKVVGKTKEAKEAIEQKKAEEKVAKKVASDKEIKEEEKAEEIIEEKTEEVDKKVTTDSEDNEDIDVSNIGSEETSLEEEVYMCIQRLKDSNKLTDKVSDTILKLIGVKEVEYKEEKPKVRRNNGGYWRW